MKPTPNSPEAKTAVSVAMMRASDAYTIAHFVPGRELMRRAAQGIFDAADAALAAAGGWQGKSVAIIAGSGNNGGDGYALAGILAGHGVRPRIFCVSEKFSEDGRYYYEQALAQGVPAGPFLPDAGAKSLAGYDVIVDCILGTGFAGTPRGAAAEAIRAINASGAFVVSADINSGMNGDTGEAVLAVRSDLTVSIGFYKTGLFLGRAPELIRELVNVDIGIVRLPNRL